MKEQVKQRESQITPLRTKQEPTPSGLNLLPSTSSPMADALAKVPSPYTNKKIDKEYVMMMKSSVEKGGSKPYKKLENCKHRVKTPSMPASIVNLHQNIEDVQLFKNEIRPQYFRKLKEAESQPHYIHNLDLLNKLIGKISPAKELLQNISYTKESLWKNREMSQQSSRRTFSKKGSDQSPELALRNLQSQKKTSRTAISGKSMKKQGEEERGVSYVDQLINIKKEIEKKRRENEARKLQKTKGSKDPEKKSLNIKFPSYLGELQQVLQNDRASQSQSQEDLISPITTVRHNNHGAEAQPQDLTGIATTPIIRSQITANQKELKNHQSKMMALIESAQLRIQNSRRYSQIKGVSHVLLEQQKYFKQRLRSDSPGGAPQPVDSSSPIKVFQVQLPKIEGRLKYYSGSQQSLTKTKYEPKFSPRKTNTKMKKMSGFKPQGWNGEDSSDSDPDLLAYNGRLNCNSACNDTQNYR